MNGVQKSIFLWGLITFIGFLVYQFFLTDASFPKPLVLWSVLTIIGIIGMIAWVPNWMKNKVVGSWILVAGGGMLYHWAFASKLIPALIPNVWAYWAILMAIGFVLTGYFWKTTFYYGVALLNALVFVLLFLGVSPIPMYGSLILGITGGIPTMYNGWKG